MQALAGSGFLMGICCPPGLLMSTPCNQPSKTQGGELLLINVCGLQGKRSRGSAGKISVRGAAAQHSMYTALHVCAPTHVLWLTGVITNPPLPPRPLVSVGSQSSLQSKDDSRGAKVLSGD